MKSKVKFFCIIAIIVIIGFVVPALFLTGCDNGNGDQNCTDCGKLTCECPTDCATCISDNAQAGNCTQPDTCTVCDEIITPAGSHTHGAEATCTTDQTCTICGFEIEAAIGHNFIYNWNETRPATCTVENEETRTCTLACGLTGHTETRSTVAAKGHSFINNWGNSTATCTVAGQETRICTLDCGLTGHTETRPAVALGHVWNWNTYESGSGLRECQRSDCSITAGIGDTGPAGGIIFYNSKFDFFTGTDSTYVERYYLEAWTSNESNSVMSNPSIDVSGLSNAIGVGRRNTKIIVAAISAQSGRAAQLCDNARHSGLDDWFLPSINELQALAQLGGQYGIPNEGYFWSSSRNDNASMRGLDFATNNVRGFLNTQAYNVRAVRAF